MGAILLASLRFNVIWCAFHLASARKERKILRTSFYFLLWKVEKCGLRHAVSLVLNRVDLKHCGIEQDTCRTFGFSHHMCQGYFGKECCAWLYWEKPFLLFLCRTATLRTLRWSPRTQSLPQKWLVWLQPLLWRSILNVRTARREQ